MNKNVQVALLLRRRTRAAALPAVQGGAVIRVSGARAGTAGHLRIVQPECGRRVRTRTRTCRRIGGGAGLRGGGAASVARGPRRGRGQVAQREPAAARLVREHQRPLAGGCAAWRVLGHGGQQRRCRSGRGGRRRRGRVLRRQREVLRQPARQRQWGWKWRQSAAQ